MRLSRLLKLSFVGTLLFSPAMAQEADKVHQEALKVLRTGSSDTNHASATPAARSGPESRQEREARLRAEAQQRLADRERQQAEKRRQFEEYIKERERLRSGKPANDVQSQAVEVLRKQTATPPPAPATPASTPAAAPVAAPAPVQPQSVRPAAVAPVAPATTPAAQPSNEELQQRALEILRNQRQESATPAAAPVRESELAPRTVAPPSAASAAPARSTTPPPATPVTRRNNNSEETHQKALEVLRQQTQSPAPATPSATPATTPAPRTAPAAAPKDDLKPSPELQRRLDEMQRELQTPPPRATSQADPAYTRELEQRALEMMRSTPATAATTPAKTAPVAPAAPTAPRPMPKPAQAPATAITRTPGSTTPATVDARTREMLRRQDEQLSRQSAAPASVRPGALDPAAEARARELLRQQQQAVATSSPAAASTVPAAQPQPAVTTPVPARTPPTVAASPTPAPSTASTAAPATGQYSQELENRARQALLERGQNQPSTTTPPPEAAQAAAAAASSISTTPVPPDPNLNQVHTKAMETLVQVQPGQGGQTEFKSKQERLRALTDLYKADRLTPAEYHQRRAQILAEPNK